MVSGRSFIGFIAIFSISVFAAGDNVGPGANSRSFEFTYSATFKDVPEKAKHVDLWIPVPQSDKFQTISALKFFAPGKPELAVEPVHNNQMVHWRIDAATARDLTVTMTFNCTRLEISAGDVSKSRELSHDEKKELNDYLRSNKLVLVGGKFSKIADAAVQDAKNPTEILVGAYNYTVANMEYKKPADQPGWGKGSTQWACDAKFGNCTDFHALVMSIARTKGMPAKFEMGFPLPEPVADKPETRGGTIGGYHCWAKLYLGGVGWVPVDASEAQKHPEKKDYFLGNLDANRVHFSNDRDVNLVPKQSGDALNYFIYPYAEADGKTISVDKAFSFIDLKTIRIIQEQ